MLRSAISPYDRLLARRIVVNWPRIDDISAKVPLPEGYRFEQLKRSEISSRSEKKRP